MPRKKPQSRNRISVSIDADMMMHLLNGKLNLDFIHNKKLVRSAWQKSKHAIMSVWVDVLPGCRPYAWWAFDAPEPRRAVKGVAFYDRRADILPAARRYAFGLPTGTDFKDDEPVVYESEVDYLDRLELLTEPEKEMPLDRMRLNSCYSFRRKGDGLAAVDAVMEALKYE